MGQGKNLTPLPPIALTQVPMPMPTKCMLTPTLMHACALPPALAPETRRDPTPTSKPQLRQLRLQLQRLQQQQQPCWGLQEGGGGEACRKAAASAAVGEPPLLGLLDVAEGACIWLAGTLWLRFVGSAIGRMQI